MKIYEHSNTIFNYLEYAESNGVLVLSAYRVKFDEIGAQSFYFLHGLLWNCGKKLLKLSASERKQFFEQYKIYHLKEKSFLFQIALHKLLVTVKNTEIFSVEVSKFLLHTRMSARTPCLPWCQKSARRMRSFE